MASVSIMLLRLVHLVLLINTDTRDNITYMHSSSHMILLEQHWLSITCLRSVSMARILIPSESHLCAYQLPTHNMDTYRYSGALTSLSSYIIPGTDRQWHAGRRRALGFRAMQYVITSTPQSAPIGTYMTAINDMHHIMSSSLVSLIDDIIVLTLEQWEGHVDKVTQFLDSTMQAAVHYIFTPMSLPPHIMTHYYRVCSDHLMYGIYQCYII